VRIAEEMHSSEAPLMHTQLHIGPRLEWLQHFCLILIPKRRKGKVQLSE